jgi:hypothetical protein
MCISVSCIYSFANILLHAIHAIPEIRNNSPISAPNFIIFCPFISSIITKSIPHIRLPDGLPLYASKSPDNPTISNPASSSIMSFSTTAIDTFEDLIQRVRRADSSVVTSGGAMVMMSMMMFMMMRRTSHSINNNNNKQHHHEDHSTTSSNHQRQQQQQQPSTPKQQQTTTTTTRQQHETYSPVPPWAVPARGSLIENHSSPLPSPPPNNHNHSHHPFIGVRQTIFDMAKGNALQACIASILRMELHQVPNFVTFGDSAYDELRRFLAQHGMGFVKIELKNANLPFAPFGTNSLCVMAGRSPRGNYRHAIVGKLTTNSVSPQPFYDPHPEQTMLKSYDWVGLLVKVLED